MNAPAYRPPLAAPTYAVQKKNRDAVLFEHFADAMNFFHACDSAVVFVFEASGPRVTHAKDLRPRCMDPDHECDAYLCDACGEDDSNGRALVTEIEGRSIHFYHVECALAGEAPATVALGAA